MCLFVMVHSLRRFEMTIIRHYVTHEMINICGARSGIRGAFFCEKLEDGAVLHEKYCTTTSASMCLNCTDKLVPLSN